MTQTKPPPAGPIKFLETIDDYTSLEQQIQDAWRFMASNLRGLKVKAELEPTRRDLFDYASGNSSIYGPKVAMTEAMRDNPSIRGALLDGRTPILDASDHTDTFMLYLAAQIAGRPTVAYNDIAGKANDGPGRILRNFSTRQMQETYVPHLGALQRVAALAREAGKVTLYKQAVQKAKDVRIAGLERAVEMGLTREWGYFNHKISELLPKPAEVKEGFDRWMALKHKEYDDALAPKGDEVAGGKPTASAAPPPTATTPEQAFAAADAPGKAAAKPRTKLIPAKGVATAAPAPAPRAPVRKRTAKPAAA
jgi:hypothetical protein